MHSYLQLHSLKVFPYIQQLSMYYDYIDFEEYVSKSIKTMQYLYCVKYQEKLKYIQQPPLYLLYQVIIVRVYSREHFED